MTDIQQTLDKAIADIAANHRQILDDWCKAYMAQLYEEGADINPGSFTLCEQVMTYHAGKNCMVRRYWFEPGIPEFDK